MKVRYTPRAYSDLEKIRTYIAQFDPTAAGRVVTVLERAVNRLTDFPAAGEPFGRPDVRVIFAVRYPYRIYYRVASDTIDILHIRHVARKPVQENDL